MFYCLFGRRYWLELQVGWFSSTAGPVNDLIVWLGLAADDNRPELMYNVSWNFCCNDTNIITFYGFTFVQCNENYLPSLMRAGKSLGGTPLSIIC